MTKKMFLFFAAVYFVSILQFCNNQPVKEPTTEVSTKTSVEDPLKKGEYLVSILGCDDCHSPKKMGANGPELIAELRLSGHTANTQLPPVDAANITKNGWILFWADLTTTIGPWGQSYAANITSDATGIGTWTEDRFSKAMREGKFGGMDDGRPILPPMPWQSFKNLTDEDLKAVFTYLKSTKPVKNVVAPPKLNAPPKS